MFQFTAFASHDLCIQSWILQKEWVSPFGHLRIKARLPAPRSFSQAITSFIACNRQGIHHMHLFAWSYNVETWTPFIKFARVLTFIQFQTGSKSIRYRFSKALHLLIPSKVSINLFQDLLFQYLIREQDIWTSSIEIFRFCNQYYPFE